MQFKLNKENIEKAIVIFADNQNFTHTAKVRLLMLNTIKKEFKHLAELDWFFEFDHVNVNNNRVYIEYTQNKSKDFTFFYEIPLTINFELRVFLAKSSIHFLDLYNFLLLNEKLVISNKKIFCFVNSI